MGLIPLIEPAHMFHPGVVVTENGIIVSTVFREADSCGIILYHIADGISVRFPFTDEYRFGSLYSVKISPLQANEWCYQLYSGSTCFVDPGCRSVLEIESEGKMIRAGGFFYEPDHHLPAYRSSLTKKDGDDFIYCLHVRGFTMLSGDLQSVPGTFSAAAEKIDYLKSLGVTAVELMPVYELQPETRANKGPRTMEDALALYPVNIKGHPIRDLSVPRINYWGYTRGFYYAPRASLSTPGYPGGPQKEFADMVRKFHDAGISVYLQLFFPGSVSTLAQTQIVRFYVTHYAIDGFHLMGSIEDLRVFSSDPILADTKLFHTSFPYEDIVGTDAENPESGLISTANLYNYNSVFSNLLRCFVKSDDYVLREFMYEFLKVPAGHGNVHYICSNDGFTLRDLVSYNDRHNEANGEGGNDGTVQNYSWNCGVEGDTDDEEVLRLRGNQIRNMLTLLFLSQSTPLLNAGDEVLNTQQGNNNPYCQDNELGWTGWDNGEAGEETLRFLRKIIAFKKAHRIFTGVKPFKSTDYLGCGYPDLSLHGEEAWKPDLGQFSHSIGICLCENYVRPSDKTDLIYLAVNMHWESRELGLPKLAPGRRWNLLVDTALEDSFIEGECIMDDQRIVEVAPRSIRILNTVTSNKPVRRRPAKKKAAPVTETVAAPESVKAAAPDEKAVKTSEPAKAAAPDAEPVKKAESAKAAAQDTETVQTQAAAKNITPDPDEIPAQNKVKDSSNEEE